MASIRRVILVGANGKLGPHILQALLDTPQFDVSVLTRASSSSKYPTNIHVAKVGDDLPLDELRAAFQGQDALVIAYSGNQTENSIKMIDAAFAANVKHVIPADYGSCDSSDPRSLSLVPLYVNKKDVRDHLTKLAAQERDDGSHMTWTSLITGHFFDYGLKSGLLSMNVDERSAIIFDKGEYKFAATTLAQIGRAAASILLKHTHPRLSNRLVYIQSIQTTQNELVQAVEKVIGQHIEATHVTSQEFIDRHKRQLAEDVGNADLTEELVTVEGIVNTNFDTKGDAFVNDLLEIPTGNLDQMIRHALK